MIHMSDVHVRYGRTQALRGVDLHLDTGVTAVLGPNGAGKTTLLRLLATTLEPSQGTMSILGLNPRDPRERTAIREQLGFLPQDTDTNPNQMRVGEVIDYLAVLKGIRDQHDRLRAVAQVVTDHHLEPHLESRFRDLSAGVRRRVLLAQAFLGKPRALILDEPFTDLDLEHRTATRHRIAELRGQSTMVVATHDIDEFVEASDTVVILQAGWIRFSGPPADLAGRSRPNDGTSLESLLEAMQNAYIATTRTQTNSDAI